MIQAGRRSRRKPRHTAFFPPHNQPTERLPIPINFFTIVCPVQV